MSAGAVRSLQLAGEMTIQTAAEEKAGLLAFLDVTSDEGVDVELGLADVTEIDTAGLQLLLMAQREAQAQGRRLWISSPSQSVVDVLAIAHLNPDLEPTGPGRPEEAGR